MRAIAMRAAAAVNAAMNHRIDGLILNSHVIFQCTLEVKSGRFQNRNVMSTRCIGLGEETVEFEIIEKQRGSG